MFVKIPLYLGNIRIRIGNRKICKQFLYYTCLSLYLPKKEQYAYHSDLSWQFLLFQREQHPFGGDTEVYCRARAGSGKAEIAFSGHLCENLCSEGPILRIDEKVYKEVNLSSLYRILEELKSKDDVTSNP